MTIPTPKDLSREHRIYLAIWRKSLTSPKPVELTLPTKAMALTVRMAMYRAIRPFREGARFDEGLHNAAEKFVVAIAPGEGETWKLLLKERLTLTEMEKQLFDLGISEDDLLLTEEKLLQGELAELTSSEIPRPSNPFYSRED